MYTLLIVDDEEIEREGMAQFIPWDSYEIKVVSTARNGAEGLEKIQQEFSHSAGRKLQGNSHANTRWRSMAQRL